MLAIKAGRKVWEATESNEASLSLTSARCCSDGASFVVVHGSANRGCKMHA